MAVRSGDVRQVRHRLLQRLALARRATYEFIDKYEFIAVTDFVTMAYDIFLMHSCFVCLCSAFGTFAYSHERIAQKWAAPASSPIAWRISVDFEERMRRSTQTGSAFCCSSFGSSFLYILSCHRKSLATLRSEASSPKGQGRGRTN